MTDESIEIHFDERRGHLELACGADAFKSFRNFAENELKDFPDIEFDKVSTIEILDTAAFVARRDSNRNRWLSYGCCIIALILFGVISIGVRTIIGWLFGR
jgi:hypothetical protein